jgi:hypothetical protein
MASKIIGRTKCPECGFDSAHVKQSDKCIYRYCPECQSQHHARTERQRTDLLAKTRMATPTEPSPTPREPGPAPSTPTETPTPAASAAKPAKRGLFF